MDPRQYPIGTYSHEGPVSDTQLDAWIGQIEALPAHFADAARGLSPERLDAPYRPGGWTRRQVIHHVPDSHLNAYVRFKWALTEDEPTIKAYDEVAWAELPDVRSVPMETSLAMLSALHARWTGLLRGLSAEQWDRALVHPVGGRMPLRWMAGMYAWHGRHHLAHLLLDD